jgi:hypothetical protein
MIPKEEADVRESLRLLTQSCPKFIDILAQLFLTWMSGKPYKGQKPLFKATRGFHLFTALASLFGGAVVSAFIWNSSPILLPLLPVSWAFTVGGARTIQTSLCHRFVHHQFFGDARDRWLAEILSTLLLIQDFEGYRKDHVKLHHHVDYFTSFEHDPDAQFLWQLGFRPGLADNTKR